MAESKWRFVRKEHYKALIYKGARYEDDKGNIELFRQRNPTNKDWVYFYFQLTTDLGAGIALYNLVCQSVDGAQRVYVQRIGDKGKPIEVEGIEKTFGLSRGEELAATLIPTDFVAPGWTEDYGWFKGSWEKSAEGEVG